MTFLEIVRRVAQRTGTTDPRSISSAIGATGRVATVANLTIDAWTAIQTERKGWRFLVRDIPEAAMLSTGIRAYTAASLDLDNWAEWIPGNERGETPLSVWPDGERAKERRLGVVDHREYHRVYQTGENADPVEGRRGQPRVVAIDQQDQLVVWPIPDQDYRLAGTYRRGAQIFAADTEEPIFLEQYHPAVVSAGVLAVHFHDEAPANSIIAAQADLDRDMHALRRRYLYADPIRVETQTVGPTERNRGYGSRSSYLGDVDAALQDGYR